MSGRIEKPEPRVLETCEALHMMANGSMDIADEQDALRLEAWLQRKVSNWSDAKRGDYCAMYDGAVKLLAIAALAEWRLSSFHPNWPKHAKAAQP